MIVSDGSVVKSYCFAGSCLLVLVFRALNYVCNLYFWDASGSRWGNCE